MKLTAILLLSLVGLSPLLAQSDSEALRRKHYNLDENQLAISGYDPVAYFTQSQALKGKASLPLKYKGLTYYFSSTKNQDLFRQSPEKYLPAYGGWCAYAMGNSGEKVEIDPATFKIVEGKLYLFYNAYFNNTLKDWNKNEKALKSKADQNWQKTLNP